MPAFSRSSPPNLQSVAIDRRNVLRLPAAVMHERFQVLSIGAFCVAAVVRILFQSAQVVPVFNACAAAYASVMRLPPAAIGAKRLTTAEKTNLAEKHVAG